MKTQNYKPSLSYLAIQFNLEGHTTDLVTHVYGMDGIIMDDFRFDNIDFKKWKPGKIKHHLKSIGAVPMDFYDEKTGLVHPKKTIYNKETNKIRKIEFGTKEFKNDPTSNFPASISFGDGVGLYFYTNGQEEKNHPLTGFHKNTTELVKNLDNQYKDLSEFLNNPYNVIANPRLARIQSAVVLKL